MADKKKPGCLARLLAAVLMLALTIWLVQKMQCNSSPSRPAMQPEGTRSSSQPARPQVDPALQAERKALIQKLIAQGVFQKVERRGRHIDLWATPLFAALDFDAKQDFVNVVYAWLHDSLEDSERDFASVSLKDSKTGKEIGTYDRGWTGELKLRMK